MKKICAFMMGAAMGMGALALYNKYGMPSIDDIKQTVKKTKKDVSSMMDND